MEIIIRLSKPSYWWFGTGKNIKDSSTPNRGSPQYRWRVSYIYVSAMFFLLHPFTGVRLSHRALFIIILVLCKLYWRGEGEMPGCKTLRGCKTWSDVKGARLPYGAVSPEDNAMVPAAIIYMWKRKKHKLKKLTNPPWEHTKLAGGNRTTWRG